MQMNLAVTLRSPPRELPPAPVNVPVVARPPSPEFERPTRANLDRFLARWEAPGSYGEPLGYLRHGVAMGFSLKMAHEAQRFAGGAPDYLRYLRACEDFGLSEGTREILDPWAAAACQLPGDAIHVILQAMRVLLEPAPASTRALASLEALLPALRGEVKVVRVIDLLGTAADALILWALLPSLPPDVLLPGWDAPLLALFTADHRQSDRVLHALTIARHNGIVLPTGPAVIAADKAAAARWLPWLHTMTPAECRLVAQGGFDEVVCRLSPGDSLEILERHSDVGLRRHFLRHLRTTSIATAGEAGRWRQVLPQDSSALFAENGCLARWSRPNEWCTRPSSHRSVP